MAAKSYEQIRVNFLLDNGQKADRSQCICQENVKIQYECPRLECNNVTIITDIPKEECNKCTNIVRMCGGAICRTCTTCKELGYSAYDGVGDGRVYIYKTNTNGEKEEDYSYKPSYTSTPSNIF